MSGFTAEIIERRPGAVTARVAGTECGAGCGCDCRKAVTMTLPPVEGEQLVVSMNPADQWVLLLNTLLLPLLGFVAGAILAQWILPNDLAAFAGAVAGTGAGVLVCRKQSFDRVEIEEV